MHFIFYDLLYNPPFEIKKKLHKVIGLLNKTRQIMQQENVFIFVGMLHNPPF